MIALLQVALSADPPLWIKERRKHRGRSRSWSQSEGGSKMYSSSCCLWKQKGMEQEQELE
jgi:hypothetical protein